MVNVTEITQGDFPGSFTPNTFFTANGWVKVVVDVGANPSLTGDNITVAYFTLEAVGNAGTSSYLNLEVQSLLNDSFAAIPFTPINGTFLIPAATKVVIPSVSVEQGANTIVPVMIKNATDAVSGTSIKLWFNPAVVNVTEITQGDFPGSFTPNTFFTANGWVKVVVDVGANPSLTGDNITVAYFTLEAVGNAGTSSYLNLEVQSLLNDSFAAIPFTPINGTFTVSTGPPAPTLVTYTITNTTITLPQTTSIDVRFSERVSAIIKIEDASGNLVNELYSSPDVTNPLPQIWDGTYESNGTQVPGGVYTVNVTGTNTTTGLSVTDTTKTIIVIPPPPVLTSIEVSPQTATLNITETQQFTTTAKDQYGNTMPGIIFTWSSSNTATGVINQNGLFTANAPGTTTVKAANGSINGTASVVVIFKADYTLFLATGWNFVSIPKKLAAGNNTVEDVFGDVNRSSHSIFLYNTSTAEWNVMNLTDEVKPLDGIWIYSAESKVIPITFDNDPLRTPPTKMLYNGWNAIGLSDTIPTSANDALSPVEDKWTFLIGFDAINQQYQTTIINNNHDGDERDEGNPMNSGIGYWVYMKEDGELAGLSV
ncbi:MAG: Bacterial Ig-like domain (group 2) [Candidatus Argoarchaeum ethanivorans]|uniref:Bacterial Ig-like domain (Group 2) n=1 Tax=Candidatus Argoarchaeum ethanivorans TaxID=2608793 RepID=A0A811TJD0_9EURY|nr:MAG: Bacterial Ig-like domain (group 2) [Candidatus Argoarchaeum ethanivorans]